VNRLPFLTEDNTKTVDYPNKSKLIFYPRDAQILDLNENKDSFGNDFKSDSKKRFKGGHTLEYGPIDLFEQTIDSFESNKH